MNEEGAQVQVLYRSDVPCDEYIVIYCKWADKEAGKKPALVEDGFDLVGFEVYVCEEMPQEEEVGQKETDVILRNELPFLSGAEVESILNEL